MGDTVHPGTLQGIKLKGLIEMKYKYDDGEESYETALHNNIIQVSDNLKPKDESDEEIKEYIGCLRCGERMKMIGPEHTVTDHGSALFVVLYSCMSCDYLEYRKIKYENLLHKKMI